MKNVILYTLILFKREIARKKHEKKDPRQSHNGQTDQKSLIQVNLGYQGTILFIARVARLFRVTIWIPVTARRLEDTLFTIFTRPPIRVLSSWVLKVTLAVTKGVSHVFTIFTQGFNLSATGHVQPNATVIVASEERII